MAAKRDTIGSAQLRRIRFPLSDESFWTCVQQTMIRLLAKLAQPASMVESPSPWGFSMTAKMKRYAS